MGDQHLRSEHYVDGTGAAASMLARRTHDHLMASCPACREQWEQLGGLQDAYLAGLRRFTLPSPPPPVDDDELPVHAASLDAHADYVDELRHLRRRAQEQVSVLRRLPTEERPARIRRAYRQFRGRTLAELLIEESRATVRTDPAAALAWVDLVPLVLDWTRGEGGPDWVPPLLARAAAHRANALRVAGDLPAAERTFVELRRSLAAQPVGDPAAVAEVASLEASLRIGQHRHGHAEELLARAALAYRYAGDSLGLARTRIQQASLVRRQGRPAEVLRLLEEASSSLGADGRPADLQLTLWTATGRVNALCDLERFPEARQLLDRHLDDYEASDDPHSAAVFRCLAGRIALGLRDFERAEEAFTSCRDAMLIVGRNHDAALACLFLAEVLFLAGRTRDLARLAAQLVPLFRSRELPAESFKALQLLAQAATADRLTEALLAKIRQRLAAAGSASMLPVA